jgi:thiamine pyrophosphate-dependent acetolactate synthase large subunit-like protein
MPTGAELFITSLKKLGTTQIFTLVGDHLNEILRVADREGLSVVDTRHESAAVHMADGWGRITRTPGVSMVTGAPGHTNSITGIATAYYTGSPLLAMSGMSSSKLRDRYAFQDMDQLALVQGITKYAAVPAEAGQIPFYVHRAFLESMTGRSGPTHLSVPVDLLTAQVENHFPLPRGPIQIRRPGPEPAELDLAVALLESAERPAVIAGSGAWWADAGATLEAFIEKTSLPLFTVGLARGLVSDEHPLCFGYADPTLNRAAEKTLQQADVILVIGKKLDYRLRLGSPQLFSPDAKLIQIDIHSAELGLNRRVEVGMVADAKVALEGFVEAFGNRPQPDRSSWIEGIRETTRTTRDELEAIAQKPSQPMHALQFFRELLAWLPHDATLCWDGGDFVHWGRNYIPARKPMHWLRLGGLAGLGVCFPIGLAAQIARPDSRAVVITGDGSLGFYLAEMDTAVRFGLPVIVIVGNDGGWGIERELQRGAFGSDKTVACELRRTRYDLVMKAFGGDGEFVERPEQIRPALDRALRSDKPFLINVDIRGCASPFTEYQLRRLKR